MMTSSPHAYEIRPRKDKRGVDLISDVLPFGRLRLCAFTLLVTAQVLCGSPNEITPLPPPTTRIDRQIRTELKHRPRPISYNVTPTTVDQIVALNRHLPAGVNTSVDIRRSKTPISPYETQVFRVEGDLRQVKMEANDNEYHLEISRRGGRRNSNRIIVEIPPEYRETRRALLSLLPGNYVFRPDKTVPLSPPIPIRVTGFAFYDGAHWARNDIQGHGHGSEYVATLWEIHPAWKIERIVGR
jgi:hypothetical protein